MQGIFNHTHRESSNWRDELKQYKEEKQKLAWNITEKPRVITYRTMKEKEDEFNPILQRYNDKDYENQIKLMSNINLRHTIAKNRDNSLRIEQTYDIITLENKLKGLNNKNYKQSNSRLEREVDNNSNQFIDKNIKSRAKSNKLNSKVNHNILTNITVDKHSTIEPELRPVITEMPSPKRIQKVNANYYREYDIISNNYKEYHIEKTKIDKEISKIENAKKYNKLNNYNPIRAEFYDKEKENEFQVKREEKKKNWEKDHKNPKYNLTGYLYNPINMSVINVEGLEEADRKALNKKKRYQLRSLIDCHYHKNDVERSKSKDETILRKISYNRFREFDEREFDILRQDFKKEKEYKDLNPKCKDLKSDWEKLKQNAGEKATLNNLDTINLFKEPHDYSDMAKTTKQFMINRKNILQKLPKLKEDSIFNKTNAFVKIKRENEKKNEEDFNQTKGNFRNNLKMEKDEWFGIKKNNFYKEDGVEKVNYFQDRYIATADSSIKSRPTLFVENKIKKRENEKNFL